MKRPGPATGPGDADNTLSGDVAGTAVQAHTIHGGVHTTTVLQRREPLLALDAVPAAPDGFVGRGDELALLCGRLNPTGDSASGAGAVVVSAVSGMGGVGKTALVLKAAQVASASEWFCAHLFVDLHGYTPHTTPLTGTAALDALLRQMGVDPADIPAEAGQRAGFYRSALQALSRADEDRRPVLVVADNAHQIDQVRPLLPGGGGHRLLVTSRKALALDGHRPLSLGTLSVGEAVELLRSRLGADDARCGDQEGVEALAERCGYLPLALKIAAALMVGPPDLAPGRVADRLAELSRFSDEEDDLGAVFAASVERLPVDRVRAFALLGLAPGTDISTSAVAHMVGLEMEDTEEVLEELAAAHLVAAPAPGRWAMHDLVAEYARTLEPPPPATAPEPVWRRIWKRRRPPGVGERDRALGRVLAFYTIMADAADDHLRALKGDTPPALFSGRAGALEWLDAEIDNLLACVRIAHHTHRTRTAIDLPQILGTYLDLRRRFTEAIEVHTLARESARQTGDTGDEAVACNNLGTALRQVRKFDEAIDAHTRAREAFHQIGDAHREALAWNNLGAALAEVRKFDEAIDAHTRARDLHHQAGNAHGEASAWNNLGAALREVRRFGEAIEVHTRARDLYHQVGDAHREALAWNNLGAALQEVRRFDEAIDAHTRAREAFHQIGDAHREAQAWGNLGLALGQVGRVEEALEAFARDLDYCRQAGDGHGEAQTLVNVGRTLAGLGRVGEAVQALTRAVELFEAAGDDHSAAQAREVLDLLRQDPGGEQES